MRRKGRFCYEKSSCVIYWSGTGNTEAMANAVAEGQGAGAGVSLLSADAVSAADLAGLDAVALGCPAKGSKVLEEDVFEPMFSSCKKQFVGKSAALFGSYGWGRRRMDAHLGAGLPRREHLSCVRASSAARPPATSSLKPAANWAASL